MEQDKSHLPPEIIEIILSKLSGKSLLRFKSVSKSWNTTISDPLFVQNYRHVSKYSNSHHLFLRKILSLESFSLVKFENGKFQTEQPLKSPNGYNKLLCHCDGVLLLTHSYLKKIELWNPSNGTEVLFSSPYDIEAMLCYGLCHDPTVGYFKVVLIFNSYYLVFSGKYKACTTRKEFEDHRGRVMGGSDVTRGSGVSVDGVVYWVIRDTVGTEIIYFDPRDDKFKILQKPENVDGRKSIYLVDLRGCLCLYCNGGGDRKKVIIWTKGKGRDETSWKKLITIENVETPINRFEPQCFAENKILIMLHLQTNLPDGDDSRRSRLVVYFPFRKTFQEVEEVEDAERYELVPYVDSKFCAARKTKRKRKRKRKCL